MKSLLQFSQGNICSQSELNCFCSALLVFRSITPKMKLKLFMKLISPTGCQTSFHVALHSNSTQWLLVGAIPNKTVLRNVFFVPFFCLYYLHQFSDHHPDTNPAKYLNGSNQKRKNINQCMKTKLSIVQGLEFLKHEPLRLL